jgi:hypothetical protein
VNVPPRERWDEKRVHSLVAKRENWDEMKIVEMLSDE